MNEELTVLRTVAQSLDKAAITYMVSGSMAANYYTIPRMTRDIDVVIELRMDDLTRFTSAFEGSFYVDREVIAREIPQCGMFNLIHNEYLLNCLRRGTHERHKHSHRSIVSGASDGV